MSFIRSSVSTTIKTFDRQAFALRKAGSSGFQKKHPKQQGLLRQRGLRLARCFGLFVTLLVIPHVANAIQAADGSAHYANISAATPTFGSYNWGTQYGVLSNTLLRFGDVGNQGTTDSGLRYADSTGEFLANTAHPFEAGDYLVRDFDQYCWVVSFVAGGQSIYTSVREATSTSFANGCANISAAAVPGTNCPDVNSNATDQIPLAIGSSDGTCHSTQAQAIVYDQVETMDFAGSVLFGLYPDLASRSGATYPAKFVMMPVNGPGTTRINTTATCPGGTVTGSGGAVVSVELVTNTSCELTLVGPAGTGGADITYKATVTRTGDVYSGSNASLDGDVFNAGVSVPEIDLQRPAGVSVSDGGTDAQGNQDAGSQVTLNYTVANTGIVVLNVSAISSTNPVNVSVDSISSGSFPVAAGSTATFTLRYTPTAAGAFSFELDITSDDADEGNYDVTVSGTALDTVAPNVEILDAPASVFDNEPFGVTFVFSESVSGFTGPEITVGNGIATGFTTVDGTTYTADITPDGNGDVTIDVATAVAQDAAGNDNTAATQVVVSYGHILLAPARGEAPGEDVGLAYSATQADGVTVVSATLSVEANAGKIPTPPEAANSLVSAVSISSTSSVNGYILAVTFNISAASPSLFTGFWKYGVEVPGDPYQWYDYGTRAVNGDGTGYEISVDQKTLTVYLIDGVRGDNDWQVNAAITDPGLPLIRRPEAVFKNGFEPAE